MASPQKENGYTPIANEILEALIKYPLNGTQWRILLAVVKGIYLEVLWLRGDNGYIQVPDRNVVSVPSGSNSFTWIDNCWDWLEKVQEFIIFGDNDAPGLKMIEELCIRLGRHRTKVIRHQYKDANEVLFHQGKDEILRLISEAIDRTPAGIIDMSKVHYEGIKDDDGIPTGFYGLDSTIEDLKPGQLSILVGRNSEGKSTVVSQIICNAIDHDIPVFLYSGEMSTQRILNWLFRQAIGDERQHLDFIQGKYKLKAEVRPKAVKALMQWMEGKFYTFDKSIMNIRKDTGS